MWNELESYKNHFLKRQTPYLKSETLNELAKNEFRKAQEKRDVCIFPRETATCIHSTYFKDHTELAYGWYKLPKLMRELLSGDLDTHWRAINTLSEVLLNPMHAQRAINEMDIIRKAQNTFVRFRRGKRKPRHREIQQLMQIFFLLSNYLNGAHKIAERDLLREEFYKMVITKDKHKDIAVKILRNLSEKPEVLLFLLEKTDSFEKLRQIFHKDVCVLSYPDELWTHLSHFLDIAPEQGIEAGFFEILHKRISAYLPKYHRLNMKCFALLLRCEEGQKRFDAVDGVKLVYTICTEEKLDEFKYLMLTLLQGLHSKKSLYRVREFTDLFNIVMGFAKDTSNAQLQLYSLQVLRQMGVMPCIKRYLRDILLLDLKKLVCSNKINECLRDNVVLWLKRDIYETDDYMEYS